MSAPTNTSSNPTGQARRGDHAKRQRNQRAARVVEAPVPKPIAIPVFLHELTFRTFTDPQPLLDTLQRWRYLGNEPWSARCKHGGWIARFYAPPRHLAAALRIAENAG